MVNKMRLYTRLRNVCICVGPILQGTVYLEFTFIEQMVAFVYYMSSRYRAGFFFAGQTDNIVSMRGFIS
jgi:hypothetical protein